MTQDDNMSKPIAGADILKQLYFWEKDRLESFKKWPFNNESKCNIKKMAEAGFYWCGNEIEEDTAACFVCDKQLNGWEEEDDPWEEHFSHAPQCIFAKTRKPESELLIEDVIKIFEATLKSNLQKQYEAEKKKVKILSEEQKKELIKTFKRYSTSSKAI